MTRRQMQGGGARRLTGAVRVVAMALAIGAAALPLPATADVGSDHPAAILVFPKLLVDTANGLDTLVRITNVSANPIRVKCFYVNVTPRCEVEGGSSCFPDRRSCFRQVEGQIVGGKCVPQWQETDFTIRLTREQPTGWLVSTGESVNCAFLDGVCSQDKVTQCDDDGDCGLGNRCIKPPCFPLDGGVLGRTGPDGQDNQPSAVPLSPEDPFVGELKCIALDEGDRPVARNDLIGTALIARREAGPEEAIEVASYNAIGIPAIVDECLPNGTCSRSGNACTSNLQCVPTNNRDGTLVLGGPEGQAEYEGCPNVLILDHIFDGAADPLVANRCDPDGTCSVTGTECVSDNDCSENICLPSGTCSVTGTPCMAPADCQNTCIIGNTCVNDQCTVTGEACAGNGSCPNNVCSLSGEHCLDDVACTPPDFRARVATSLTLIPCTEDFEAQAPALSRTIAQFLVFNEFEQRFSTSFDVECFKETLLSNIETEQNERSIFSVGVGGTLTGQVRIRGASPSTVPDPRAGYALLGVAEEFRCAGPEFQFPLCDFVDEPERLISTTAKNLHFLGRRPESDFIYLPGE